MNYQDTIDWLFAQLPMYQNKGKTAYKSDLSNTIKLANHLKHPETKFKSVHVAGTNGKGSTSHMLASILQESGYKVGLYTSPHLKDFRERIKINGTVISKHAVIGFVKRNKEFLEKHQLSFFEMTVGMAFEYFSKQKTDIAIIEVGLGGRLDSTNIITPEVSVITNIGKDHTQFLGNTYSAIAKEKAGIIKQHIPIVIGETQKETETVFKTIATTKQSNIYFADKNVKYILPSDLKGSYQINNIKTAIETIKILNNKGYIINQDNLKKGLLNVVSNTGLLGRWQILHEKPKVVCDTAHNKEGLHYTMKQLQNEVYNTLHIVFGVVNDKDLASILPLLPKKAKYYYCQPKISRGMPVNKLQQLFTEYGFIGETYSSVNKAYKSAIKLAKSNDLVYIGGSTFVVSEII